MIRVRVSNYIRQLTWPSKGYILWHREWELLPCPLMIRHSFTALLHLVYIFGPWINAKHKFFLSIIPFTFHNLTCYQHCFALSALTRKGEAEAIP
jgi:hypothetical protein